MKINNQRVLAFFAGTFLAVFSGAAVAQNRGDDHGRKDDHGRQDRRDDYRFRPEDREQFRESLSEQRGTDAALSRQAAPYSSR